MKSIAIILVDLEHGRYGHRSALLDLLAGKPVLQHTIDRAARITGIDGIVLLHPESQRIEGRFETPIDSPTVLAMPMQARPGDAWLRSVIGSGRKWSLTAWRGGIGGMTVYDELLPAYPLAQAVQQVGAESAVVMRGDWCCMDFALASEQLRLHRSAPESMKLTFTQAPPGLSPLVIHRTLLEDLAQNAATIANLICYNPAKPVVDPACKDVNVPIPASVRDQYRRLIYDTPRAIDHLRQIAAQLGDRFAFADAPEITSASRAIEIDQPQHQFDRLPQQFTVELSPRRSVNGPIVPQHYLDLARTDMSVQTVGALLDQLPSAGDCSVLFGGLGDPLLHPQWFEVLERATGCGLLGVGIETDLLTEPQVMDQLMSLPLDVIAVRLNADTAQTYEKVMGVDGYGKVIENLQALFKLRNANRKSNTGFCGWVVPRFVKVAENLADLETFFERWMTVTGWAVIDRALTGRGLIPDMSPVPMEVPRPPGRPIKLNRQKHRLTVLSNGSLCLCGQDWLGRLSLGNVSDAPLMNLWAGAPDLADRAEAAGCVCPACGEWLEAQKHLTVGSAS